MKETGTTTNRDYVQKDITGKKQTNGSTECPSHLTLQLLRDNTAITLHQGYHIQFQSEGYSQVNLHLVILNFIIQQSIPLNTTLWCGYFSIPQSNYNWAINTSQTVFEGGGHVMCVTSIQAHLNVYNKSLVGSTH